MPLNNTNKTKEKYSEWKGKTCPLTITLVKQSFIKGQVEEVQRDNKEKGVGEFDHAQSLNFLLVLDLHTKSQLRMRPTAKRIKRKT